MPIVLVQGKKVRFRDDMSLEEIAEVLKPKDGEQGLQGIQGVRGIQGEIGVSGKDGTSGRDGIDGVDGRDGIDGLPGRDGKDGVDGRPGRDGKDGLPGRDGTDGSSVDTSDIVQLIKEELDKRPSVPTPTVGGTGQIIKYRRVTTATYTITNSSTVRGINLFGVDFAGDVTIYLPQNLSKEKFIYINDESGDASSNNITVEVIT